MNTNYQIIKLSNGENIICDIKEQSGSEPSLEVVAPLKMDVMSRMTKKGIQEGLSLTRWVQPFTDEKNIQINKSTIVTMVPASILVSSTTEDIEDPTDEELDEIALEERIQKELDSWHKEEDLEKLIEETSEFLKKNTRILH